MKNITVSVPDQVYRQARVWAARRDTSISAVVKYLLETLPGLPRAAHAFAAGCPGSLALGDRGKQCAGASLPRASAPRSGELSENVRL
jgi:hypothetical protein